MIRTQVQLEEGQYEAIRKLAHRERLSFAEVVRRLLKRGLAVGVENETGPRAAALLELAGIARGGPRDLAARHDDYLTEPRRR